MPQLLAPHLNRAASFFCNGAGHSGCHNKGDKKMKFKEIWDERRKVSQVKVKSSLLLRALQREEYGQEIRKGIGHYNS